MKRRVPHGAVLVAALVAAATGCSGSAPLGGVGGNAIRPATATLPTTLDGLQVKAETFSKAVKTVRHSYVDALGFYTFREHTNVEATLQISHFGPAAPLDDRAFLDRVRNGVVGGVSTPLLVDGVRVQQTSGLKSLVSVWFHDREMLILTVLQSYPHGRALLEAVVAQVEQGNA